MRLLHAFRRGLHLPDLLEHFGARGPHTFQFSVLLQLVLEAAPDLVLRLGELVLQPLDQPLVILVVLFLGAVAADQGLREHLDLLNHSLLFDALEVGLILAQLRLVLCCNLCQQLLH